MILNTSQSWHEKKLSHDNKQDQFKNKQEKMGLPQEKLQQNLINDQDFFSKIMPDKFLACILR